jgi:16S rRNA (guanine527-N7)-methyltransferase
MRWREDNEAASPTPQSRGEHGPHPPTPLSRCAGEGESPHATTAPVTPPRIGRLEGPSGGLQLLTDSGSRDQATAALVAGLTSGQLGQLGRYRDLLLEWNARFNLTAIKEPKAIERLLVLGAVRMLPALDAFLGKGTTGRLVDVGSGAGFPGLVLKIARPALHVTLIEATGKKVTFLQTVIDDLGLDRVTALHGRAEDLGHEPEYRGKFDVATARAVESLPALIEICFPLLRIRGRGFFPKSSDLGPELAEGKRAASIVGGRIVRTELLPHGPEERVTRLVIADKLERTPTRFPRRAGLPAREPLGKGS